jgi:ribonuclease P protein component
MPGSPGGLRRKLRRADFERATGAGRRLATRHFLVFVRERGDGGSTRLGITVTRKVGNAVRRNRIKRLVREWFRARTAELGACDLVVVARRDIGPRLALRDVRADLDAALGSRRPR